jgi:hypothetical protein
VTPGNPSLVSSSSQPPQIFASSKKHSRVPSVEHRYLPQPVSPQASPYRQPSSGQSGPKMTVSRVHSWGGGPLSGVGPVSAGPASGWPLSTAASTMAASGSTPPSGAGGSGIQAQTSASMHTSRFKAVLRLRLGGTLHGVCPSFQLGSLRHESSAGRACGPRLRGGCLL